jgi:RNA polymerase sigma factor (sigma-70 family)
MDPLDELLSPDEWLVEYARQGSGSAFTVLVSRYGDAVYTIIRNLCSTSSEADELTYQTFISAYLEIARMGPNASFQTRLYRTAIKTALAGRTRGTLEPLPRPTDEECRVIPLAQKWPNLTDPALEGSDLAKLLRDALDRIDDRSRAAFVLFDLAEVPAQETADVLQTSTREIRRCVHRVRLTLMIVAAKAFQGR